MVTKKDIAKELKAYRRRMDMSQEMLAKIVGVRRNTIVRWENGHTQVSPAMLKLLRIEDIIGGDLTDYEWGV